MATNDQTPKELTGDTKKKISSRQFRELTAQTAAMLEAQEIKAITGKDDWWCPNPECEVVDK